MSQCRMLRDGEWCGQNELERDREQRCIGLADDAAAAWCVFLLTRASTWLSWLSCRGLDGRFLLHFGGLWWWERSDDDVNDGGCAGLAASRCQRELGRVEDVAEVEQPQVGRRLGFGLRPRLGPVVPNVVSHRIDGLVGPKLPRLALARDEQRAEVDCGRGWHIVRTGS